MIFPVLRMNFSFNRTIIMKLAIIGSRNCPPIHIEDFLTEIPDAIISGGAKGVDTYAREFAKRHNIPLIEFLPEYNKYASRVAPIVRNRQIVETCDQVLAFWDGTSHGTKFSIDYSRKLGKSVQIVKI